MVVKKKVKKDVSNKAIIIVLVIAILVSLAGTLVVVDGLSPTLKIIKEGKETISLAGPLEPVSSLAQISLTVQKPLNEVNKK